MRQFRGLTKDGKWVYGWYFELDNMSFIEYQSEKSNNRCTTEVVPETVGQSTGLKDKNGKEVYVGHKYKWYQPLVENGKQIQKEHISVVTDDIVELYYLHNRAENCWGGVEIVSDIHTTPELLEKSK